MPLGTKAGIFTETFYESRRSFYCPTTIEQSSCFSQTFLVGPGFSQNIMPQHFFVHNQLFPSYLGEIRILSEYHVLPLCTDHEWLTLERWLPEMKELELLPSEVSRPFHP